MKNTLLLITLVFTLGCTEKKEDHNAETPTETKSERPELNLQQANHLATMPLKCMQQEYPYKLSQTLGGKDDLLSPSALHPAFYGCFDWHSAVHGHWSLISLLKQFPKLEKRDTIITQLQKHLSEENILAEVAYFHREYEKSFERTYGWAWLLKLAEELHTWEDTVARPLEAHLQPLTDLIINKYIEFLPKLNYPIRVGTHANTAFGLTFAYDYAVTTGNAALKNAVTQRAKDFYMHDEDCPISWEPDGYDFLSPCLEEADLMRRVLPKVEYEKWLKVFLPQLSDSDYTLAPGIVSDRTDGHLVHLDGVNFSRAWCLYGIAKTLPQYEHLNRIADEHLNYSLPNVVGDDYEGGHWLATFAIEALNARK